MAKGIRVTKEVVNLLTANQSSVETDTTGFTAVTSTPSRVTDNYWSGTASLKVITDNAGAGEGFYTANTTTTVSLAYTASVYVKGSGTVNVSLNERTAADADVGTTDSAVITLTSSWQRVTVTRTFGATGARARLYVLTDVQQDITFYADGLQLEQSAFATPWQIGGTPRTPDRYTLTRSENLPDFFEFYGSAKVAHASTTAITRTLWRQGGYRLYIDSADNKVKFTTGVTTASISDALTWAADESIHWCCGRYSDGKIKVGAKVESGTVYTGEETAAAITSGLLLYNGCRQTRLYFDGVDDVVTVPDYAGIQNIFDGGGTVEAWVKPTVVNAGAMTICAKNTQTRIILVNTQLYIIQDFSTTRGLWLKDAAAAAGVSMHVMVTYDCTNVANDPILYLNGVSTALTEVSTPVGTYTTDAGNNLFFGREIAAASYWKGSIWDVRYWTTVRTPSNDRFQRLAGNEAGLVGYWPMDACTGSTVANLVSGGNNGTITGAVWNAEQPVHGKVYNVRRDIIRSIVAAKLGVS